MVLVQTLLLPLCGYVFVVTVFAYLLCTVLQPAIMLIFRLYPVKSSKPEFLGHYSAGKNRFMPYEEVMKQSFSPVKVGDSFGPR